MKYILKISLVLMALFAISTTTIQAQQFGYVNSAELLSEMPKVKQAEANLEALQKQLQKRGQGMVKQLQDDYVNIQGRVERGELSPKQQEEEAKKLKDRETEIAKFEQNMVKQISDKRDELLKPIYDEVNMAIENVGKEMGLLFIFDQGVLLYAQEGTDVTAKVKAKLGI